jgi:hypothetical protein
VENSNEGELDEDHDRRFSATVEGATSEQQMTSSSFYSFFGLVVCCALVTKQIIESTHLSYTVPRESTLSDFPRPFTIATTPNNATNAPLWETSSTLPEWMKDYFDWHQDQLANHLNEENWQSQRYLVMRCLESEVCGGASDRLSSIPKFIRVASMSKRLLFIKWTRPAPLEDFLVPPGA